MPANIDLENAVRTSDAPPEVGQYRNPSLLAMTTVVLGLLSLAALSGTMLWFVPWITLVLGGITLRVLSVHPEKMGRRPVLIAMTLAMFVGTLGPARYYSRRYWLESKAKEFASNWLDLVRTDKLNTAFQLHIPRQQRIERDVTFDQYYEDKPSMKVDFDEFFSDQALQTLIRHGETAKITYTGSSDFEPQAGFDVVTVRYAIEFKDDGKTQRVPVFLQMVRDGKEFQGNYDWYVGHVGIPRDRGAV